MTEGYDYYQNALVERVEGILKNEFLFVLPDDVPEARLPLGQTCTSTKRNNRIWL